MNRAFFSKTAAVLAMLLLGAAYVLPTVLDLDSLPAGQKPWYAAILPEKQLKLGLDLQGGIQMVLGVDVDKAVENEAERYVTDLREYLKEKEIPYASIQKVLHKSDLEMNLESIDDKDRLLRLIETEFNVVELVKSNDDDLSYRFSIIDQRQHEIERDTIRQALETIRNRIDEFGVNEPQITTQGRNRIVVQLPGLADPERARELLGKTAQLEFRLVDNSLDESQLFRLVESAKRELRQQHRGERGESYQPAVSEINYQLRDQIPEDTVILFGDSKDEQSGQAVVKPYLLKRRVEITGEKLDDARVQSGGEFNLPYVMLRFNPAGARLFAKLTRENVNRQLAIVLDEKVSSAPVIKEPILNGRAQIEMGGLKDRATLMQEARDLVIVLRAGALPAPVDILENRAVGPSLGSDSVRTGRNSLVIGGILVIIFMLLMYRSAGLVADLVLAMNVLFILAILAAFQATLTLPGIAGLVLTVGMAVDANIIIFERIREELTISNGMLQAISQGFKKAHLTILDANVTTLIAGFVLLQYGSGPVKGFAVTLIIGIFTSYVTAMWIARFLFTSVVIRSSFLGGHLFTPKQQVVQRAS